MCISQFIDLIQMFSLHHLHLFTGPPAMIFKFLFQFIEVFAGLKRNLVTPFKESDKNYKHNNKSCD